MTVFWGVRLSSTAFVHCLVIILLFEIPIALLIIVTLLCSHSLGEGEGVAEGRGEVPDRRGERG